jgi:hypothetical protein
VTVINPTPFRRFPYVQLVFCLACLTMTAWTWMRYSYAWKVTAEELRDADGSYDGYYVYLRAFLRFDDEVHDSILWVTGKTGGLVHVDSRWPPELCPGPRRTTWDEILARVTHPRPRTEVSYTGRIFRRCLNTRASRFHGASVAGIVVGTMGVFIFGLYLRRWLRERKALASEPPQDMIA